MNTTTKKLSFVLILILALSTAGYCYGISAPTIICLLILAGGLYWIMSAFFQQPTGYGRITFGTAAAAIGLIWLTGNTLSWTPAGYAELVVHREYNLPRRGVPPWKETIIRINSEGLHAKLPWQEFVPIPLCEYQFAATINVPARGGARQVVIGSWIKITDPAKALRLSREGDVGKCLRSRFVEVSQTMVASLSDATLPREQEERIMNHGVASVLVDQLGQCGVTLRAVGVKIAEPPPERRIAKN